MNKSNLDATYIKFCKKIDAITDQAISDLDYIKKDFQPKKSAGLGIVNQSGSRLDILERRQRQAMQNCNGIGLRNDCYAVRMGDNLVNSNVLGGIR